MVTGCQTGGFGFCCNRLEHVAIQNGRLVSRLPNEKEALVLRVHGEEEAMLTGRKPAKVRFRPLGLVPIAGQQQVDHLFPRQRVHRFASIFSRFSSMKRKPPGMGSRGPDSQSPVTTRRMRSAVLA